VLHGQLLDGNGGQPLADSAVVVQADRILGVGPADTTALPDGAEIIDATGKTVMPGIIEAHAWGVPVACHVHTQPGLTNCIQTGVDQIHHGAFIDPDAVRGIHEAGLYYIPTLTVTCQRNIEGKADRPWETKEMIESQPIHRAGVRLAHEIGVKLGVGTDYPGTPAAWRIGDRTMAELRELVACGLSPMESIVAATRTNAEAFGRLDDLGTLEPGKKADLIVVNGDPLDDVAVLGDENRIELVIKDGQVESADAEYRHHYSIKEPLD